jgi:hypothetical protein
MKRYIASLIGAAAGLLLVASTGSAQVAGHDHAAASGDQHAMMSMMSDMQAKQKTLDDLVAKMNAATGQEKIDLMAAVLTEITSMHQGMICPMMLGEMMKMSGDVEKHDVEHKR